VDIDNDGDFDAFIGERFGTIKYFKNTIVLPVELLEFSGKNQGSSNLLHWTTASEENNKGFEIERSRNDRDFEHIGFIKGSGNTASERRYMFTDESLGKGIHYYRLRQVDFDGAYEYSQVIQIKVEKESVLFGEPYPNPSYKEANLSLVKENK
jgi:hypothetical protein